MDPVEMPTEEQVCDAFQLVPTYSLDPADGMTRTVTVEWATVLPLLQHLLWLDGPHPSD